MEVHRVKSIEPDSNHKIKPAVECMTTEKVSVGEVLSVIDVGHSESVCDTDIIQVSFILIFRDDEDLLRDL